MKQQNLTYNDKIIISCLLPIISLATSIVGTDHNLAFLFSIKYFKIFIYNFLEVLAVWSFFRFSLIILDKRIPLNSTNSNKRFILQVLFTLLGYVIFRSTFCYLGIKILNRSFNLRMYLNSDLPMGLTFIILINLIYAYWGHVAYAQNIKEENQIKNTLQTSPPKPSFIEIKKNKNTIYLAFEKIAYFYISNTVTYLKTTENETHIINDSLNDLHIILGQKNYYRINRQFLINQSAIHSYKVLPNRQIHISLIPPSEIDCRLNKNKSKNFKEWLSTQNRIIKPN